MQQVGVDIDENKSGLYIQKGNSPSICVSHLKGVELLPIKEALKKYDGSDGKLN